MKTTKKHDCECGPQFHCEWGSKCDCKCAANFFECLVFPDYPGTSEFPGTPKISWHPRLFANVAFLLRISGFPDLVECPLFLNFRFPFDFLGKSYFVERLNLLKFRMYIVFDDCIWFYMVLIWFWWVVIWFWKRAFKWLRVWELIWLPIWALIWLRISYLYD